MNADGAYSATAYQNEFGSWCDAIRSIGHKPVQERRGPEEVLLEAIRDLADELGRVPAAPEMDEKGAYSQRTCANRFGSWSNAVLEAGFEPVGQPKIGTSELLAEIDRLASRLGHLPTVKEMNSEGQYHVGTYSDRFESWQQAKRHAGYGVVCSVSCTLGVDPGHMKDIVYLNIACVSRIFILCSLASMEARKTRPRLSPPSGTALSR